MEPIRYNVRQYLNPRHVLMDILYTIIIGFLIAAFLTYTGITTKYFLINFIVCESLGIIICTIILLFLWIFKPENVLSKSFIAAIGLAVGILIGLQVAAILVQHFFSIPLMASEKSFNLTIILAVTLGTVFTYFFFSQGLLRARNDLIQQERLKSLASEKAAIEAKLRMLQAQVEPHFLFNTLSNILSLIDTDPSKGKSMLADLIHYLRTALLRTLPDSITLDQEMDMVKSYLNIQKIRMDERLFFQIELPDALRQHPFPPMLLQPLVENALIHGLEPKMEGGEITIKAVEEDNLIKIEVKDTGLGFSPSNNNGVGIGNVQERLKLIYGEKGRLILEENKPHGIKAVIEVPKRDVQSHHS
jgi:sensor histidine kinase YesM